MSQIDLHYSPWPLHNIGRPLIAAAFLSFTIAAYILGSCFLHVDQPGLFFLPVIAFTAFHNGVGRGLIAAGASIIVPAALYSWQGVWARDSWDRTIDLGLLAAIAPAVAIVVGAVHHRIQLLEDRQLASDGDASAENVATREQLKRSNDELDQFAYVTSHDLKAPLRGIYNLSTWIEEDLGDRFTPEAHQLMQRLRGRVERMEALINGLLEYSRIGRTAGKLEKVNVGALLVEVVDWIDPPAEIRIEIEPHMPVFLADKIRLHQVFTNLMGNAVKHHGHSAGVVLVQCTTQGRFYQFAISDDGPGIDPRYHQRIFGIFQTLLPRDRLEGTGIGLSLVKKVVESKGGSVQVESSPGKGATFRFTWPREPGGQS